MCPDDPLSDLWKRPSVDLFAANDWTKKMRFDWRISRHQKCFIASRFHPEQGPANWTFSERDSRFADGIECGAYFSGHNDPGASWRSIEWQRVRRDLPPNSLVSPLCSSANYRR
jgi:hypothetical protein